MSSLLKQKMMDITEDVIGKLNEHGNFQLFYDNECVGEFVRATNEFQLKHGYEQRGGRVLKSVTVTENPDAKYVDCDIEGGWC
ncbi:YusG family protein [uncultured Anoxybacillus sp.]|uniref:YusG family protein n=1 Tax=uncultured Anoxybacillus sp. TaxID=263860 RepID=UPI0026239DA5|nr:YusG family protein [uncultured Anoxybacillus sp.]